MGGSWRSLILAVLVALMCAACAGGGGGAGASSLDMYGTIDTGITYRSH